MSIVGQSFNGPWATGARVDFGPGSAGLATVFASGYTIAVLAKAASANFGLLGAFSDLTATNVVREFFLTNSTGGRLFGDGDFSSGFPQVGPTFPQDPDGINDNVWRWHAMSKATGPAHYEMSYADIATFTWNDGEGTNAQNHADVATAVQMFSTWAIYPLGSNAGDIAAIVVWPSAFSPAEIHTSCTLKAADLYNVAPPKGGWLFPQASVAGTIVDFTGGGANEISRQLVAASADPPGFDFTLGGSKGGLFLPFFD